MTEKDPDGQKKSNKLDDETDVSELKRMIKELRNENKTRRLEQENLSNQLAELTEQKKQLEETSNSDQTAAERLQKQLDALQDSFDKQQEDLAAERTQTKFLQVATSSNVDPVHYPILQAAVKTGAIDLDDSDSLPEVLKPYTRSQKANGGKPSNPSRKQSPGGLTMDEIGKLTPEQIIERKDEIGKVLAAQKPDK